MSNLILLISLIIAQVALSQDSPSLVIEFFRHGARSPSKTIDPTWLNHDELTFVGMRQHYLLGSIIAKRYHNLIADFKPSELYVRSTDFNRTLQSAQSQIRGIFDSKGQSLPSTSSIVNPPWEDKNQINHINNQLKDISTALPENVAVVPVHTVPLDEDNLLYLGPSSCPNSLNWFKARPIDDNSKKTFESMSDSTIYLNGLGYNLTSLQDYFLLGDTVAANYFDNRALPKHIEFNNALFNDTMFGYQWFTTYVYAGTGEQLQAFEFELANRIMDYFYQKSTNQTDLKFIMMSGHDTTLLGLLGLFNVVNPECLAANHQDIKSGKAPSFPHCNYPIYASQIFLEYYDAKDNKEASIKFIYNSDHIDICEIGGDGRCPLSKFNEVLKSRVKITKDEFNSICGITKPPSEPNHWFRIIEIILISLLALMGAALLVGVVYMIIRNNKKKNHNNYNRVNESVDAEANVNTNI